MLDQNTDRMWYVIGAVLIGAAIILGMNTLMPEAFASVGDMFGDSISVIQTNITGVGADGYIVKSRVKNGYYGNTSGEFFENNYRFSTDYILVPENASQVVVQVNGDMMNGYSHMRINAFDSHHSHIGNIMYVEFSNDTRTYDLIEGSSYIVFGFMDKNVDYYVTFQ